VRSYLSQLLELNGGTVECMVDKETGEFQGWYVALDICKKFFDNICKRLVSVDAAFMTGAGKQTGRLFNTVCLTGNNELFPLSISGQTTEDTIGWANHLQGDRKQFEGSWQGNEEEHVVTICSDRRNEAMSTIATVFPTNPHKSDIPHVIENIKRLPQSKGSGKVWKCASAATKNQHDSAMLELRAESKVSAEYLTHNVGVDHYALYTFLDRGSRLYGQAAGTQPVEAMHSLQKRAAIRSSGPLQCLHLSMMNLRDVIENCVKVTEQLKENKNLIVPYAMKVLAELTKSLVKYKCSPGEPLHSKILVLCSNVVTTYLTRLLFECCYF
jgi:hypothetical protein